MDKNLLEYEFKRKGYNVGKFCEKLGISEATYYRKTSGKSEFSRAEIERIMDLLELDSPTPIFFTR
jgi:hypothetical protein|nr:MAG TPA: Regulatory protein [Caudoviricetes sp.]DAX98433.1 MAG TPA: Regulatory protein [Caudoviricetes sp.]DAY29787.1 MAG TPA: Regulatory protein [Caudoviricetes sp.]